MCFNFSFRKLSGDACDSDAEGTPLPSLDIRAADDFSAFYFVAGRAIKYRGRGDRGEDMKFIRGKSDEVGIIRIRTFELQLN